MCYNEKNQEIENIQNHCTNRTEITLVFPFNKKKEFVWNIWKYFFSFQKIPSPLIPPTARAVDSVLARSTPRRTSCSRGGSAAPTRPGHVPTVKKNPPFCSIQIETTQCSKDKILAFEVFLQRIEQTAVLAKKNTDRKKRGDLIRLNKTYVWPQGERDGGRS